MPRLGGREARRWVPRRGRSKRGGGCGGPAGGEVNLGGIRRKVGGGAGAMMRRDDRVQEAEGLRQGYIMRELGNRNSVGNRRWDGGFKTRVFFIMPLQFANF